MKLEKRTMEVVVRSFVSSKRSSGASSGSVGTLSNGAMKKVVIWISGCATKTCCRGRGALGVEQEVLRRHQRERGDAPNGARKKVVSWFSGSASKTCDRGRGDLGVE